MNSNRPTHRLAVFVCLILQAAGPGLLLGCGLLGCSSPPKPKVTTRPTATEDEIAGRLRSGDQLSIRVDTGIGGSTVDQSSDVIIDEDGYISLTLIGRIKADGLTASELAERIQANYVPRYYVRCTATVLVAQRFFYIGGEVRNPNRFLWSEDTTLMKAISTASGFTDYANRGKVQLVRGKERPQVFDCGELQRNPSKDVPIRPGDTITVPRSIF
jgi:protein involved in polysaccharide export with SLBB domain